MSDGLSVKQLTDVITSALPNRTTVFEVIEAVEGQGKRLEVCHIADKPQPLPPVPSPARLRAHEFNDIEGLGHYLQVYGSERTVVLADVQQLTACISLNEENGEGGFETVTFKPVFHPAFATWMKIVGQTLPVLDFASFVMANRRFVEDGRSLAILFSQMRMSKKIEIAQGRGKKALNGIMVSVEIGGTRSEEFQELPETLFINVPVFLQSEPWRVELDLLVFERDNDIYVSISANDVETVRANQFIADITRLREKMGEFYPDMAVTFGKIQFKDGEFLRG